MAERRSKEEIVAALDVKIQYHKDIITKLETKKEATLNPPVKVKKPKKASMKKVLDAAKEAGLSPDDIATKLGITLPTEQ